MKKIVLTTVTTILIFIVILVVTIIYIFPIIFGTKFTLTENINIYDDDGFPSLSIKFMCSGTVTIKIIGPDSKLIDSDFFFKGNHEAILHLADFKSTVKSGQYTLRVCDNNEKEIFSEKIYFKGSNLSILSCEQKWLKEIRINSFSLFGLRLYVKNFGDIPIYPYKFTIEVDSDVISALALPSVLMPNENKYIECFIYKKYIPENNTFSLYLKDINDNILASKTILKNVVDNVSVKQFTWNNKYKVNLPISDYLLNYYTSLNRINSKDYSSYIFDLYDDQYLDIITYYLMFGFTGSSDIEKINYIASFVQNLEYKKDSETNESYEYPNYPIESLFNDNIGRDCEDKAILTASLLENMGYKVALLRFPNHMAVGVNLSKNANPKYQYYVDNYYFLETTTPGNPCGHIPNEYKDSISDVIVYPISSMPLLIHNWKNGTITVYTNTEKGDFVKVKAVIENLGSSAAKNFNFEAGFYTKSGFKINSEIINITSLNPGLKKEITICVSIPKNKTTFFKTRIFIDNEIVDEKESISSFP